MIEEKYGFIYIWYDRKHKRYYIGCHWGYETDGYICSSSWMKQSYKRRPEDFNRKILCRVNTDRKDLLKEEYKWLQLIKKEELGKKYYNLKNGYLKEHWFSNSKRDKIIKAARERKHTEEAKILIKEARNKQAPPCQNLSKKIYKNNSLGYKGVYKSEWGKFRAQIRKDGKVFSLGNYSTLEEAAIAYNNKATELYGDGAVLNFINIIKT